MSNLKLLFKSVTGLLITHLAILQLDLQEEKERVTHILLSLAGLIIFTNLLLIMLTILIGFTGMMFEIAHPLYTIIGLTIFYASGALFFVWRLRSFLKKSASFSTTFSEIKKNREAFFDD